MILLESDKKLIVKGRDGFVKTKIENSFPVFENFAFNLSNDVTDSFSLIILIAASKFCFTSRIKLNAHISTSD